jgi:hypothetical protein
MWNNYSFLYEELKNKLSELTGIECDYHESLFLPGVRSFICKKPINLLPYDARKNNYHYDNNIHFVDWKHEILHKNILESISYTLVIDVPEYTNFNWLGGTETKDKNVFNVFKIKNAIENVNVVPLEENDIIVQYNHQIHAMGDTKFTKLGQKRTSIQGCGLYDGEKIWLSW